MAGGGGGGFGFGAAEDSYGAPPEPAYSAAPEPAYSAAGNSFGGGFSGSGFGGGGGFSGGSFSAPAGYGSAFSPSDSLPTYGPVPDLFENLPDPFDTPGMECEMHTTVAQFGNEYVY